MNPLGISVNGFLSMDIKTGEETLLGERNYLWQTDKHTASNLLSNTHNEITLIFAMGVGTGTECEYYSLKTN